MGGNILSTIFAECKVRRLRNAKNEIHEKSSSSFFNYATRFFVESDALPPPET